jgi:hypothetical protein
MEQRMTRTLAMLTGSAYSGSTLLTALLDRNPAICAIGEAQKLYRQKPRDGDVCWDCTAPIADCFLWSRWDRDQPFYQFAAGNTDCPVLLDSTKDPTLMLEQWHLANRYPGNAVAVFLSKSPLEQIGSYWRHQSWRLPAAMPAPWTAEECVDEWISLNYWFHGFLQQNRIPIEFVTYSDLTKNTTETITRILTSLDVDPSATGYEWRSHTMSGNRAIVGAMTGDDVGFDDVDRADYLDGKYAGQPATLDVAYDDSWQEMPSDFRGRVDAELDRRYQEVAPLMDILGHPDV